MESVRSAQQHAFTPPKIVEPAIVSFPGGALPDTFSVTGPAGSSLLIVIVPDLAPKLAGSNRMGSGSPSPGPIVIGNESTCGTRKSGELEVIPVIVRVHLPLFVTISGSSKKDPTQTFPKFPVLAMIR